jgi:hypothetical protein
VHWTLLNLVDQRMFSQLGRSFRSFLRRHSGPSLETCLMLPKAKVVYAYIPKAACTSIKTWLLRYSRECPEIAAQFDEAEQTGAKPPDAHFTMRDHYSAKRWSAAIIRKALASPDHFKFTFVRHPLRRLVSAYLDKVVNAKTPAHELILVGQMAPHNESISPAYSWTKPQIDLERSLTFREFMGALQAADPDGLDVHFRTQDRLLRGLNFDFVGRIENLPQDFGIVQRRLQVSIPLTWKHNREYSVPVSECVADWPAARFRNVAAPPWQSFYDESLRLACCEVYADDFERFGYAPEISSARAA